MDLLGNRALRGVLLDFQIESRRQNVLAGFTPLNEVGAGTGQTFVGRFHLVITVARLRLHFE